MFQVSYTFANVVPTNSVDDRSPKSKSGMKDASDNVFYSLVYALFYFILILLLLMFRFDVKNKAFGRHFRHEGLVIADLSRS